MLKLDHMKFKYETNRGVLVKWIIIIIAVILVLSYFGISIRSTAESATGQDNFSYVWNGIVNIWNNYIKDPATYLWNIFVDLIWEPAIHNLQNMKDGQPAIQQSSVPTLPPIPPQHL